MCIGSPKLAGAGITSAQSDQGNNGIRVNQGEYRGNTVEATIGKKKFTSKVKKFASEMLGKMRGRSGSYTPSKLHIAEEIPVAHRYLTSDFSADLIPKAKAKDLEVSSIAPEKAPKKRGRRSPGSLQSEASALQQIRKNFLEAQSIKSGETTEEYETTRF